MSNRRRHSAMWDYLDSIGILEKGTEEEIKAAKKAYRKDYFLSFKRNQRTRKPEYTVNFAVENGEHGRVVKAAQRHKLAVSGFIRASTLAYLNNTYLIPDREQVARLEQILSSCLNEIRSIVHEKEKYFWERERKMEAIEKRIGKLETQIHEVFRNPPLLNRYDSQNKIA